MESLRSWSKLHLNSITFSPFTIPISTKFPWLPSQCADPLSLHKENCRSSTRPSDMSSDPQRHPDLTASGVTIPSDSENYSSNPEDASSPSPPSSSSSPLMLYSPPTIWGLLRGAAINLFLPFVNGLMLGFGELLAHEAAFQLGWSGTKVSLYKDTGGIFRN